VGQEAGGQQYPWQPGLLLTAPPKQFNAKSTNFSKLKTDSARLSYRFQTFGRRLGGQGESSQGQTWGGTSCSSSSCSEITRLKTRQPIDRVYTECRTALGHGSGLSRIGFKRHPRDHVKGDPILKRAGTFTVKQEFRKAGPIPIIWGGNAYSIDRRRITLAQRFITYLFQGKRYNPSAGLFKDPQAGYHGPKRTQSAHGTSKTWDANSTGFHVDAGIYKNVSPRPGLMHYSFSCYSGHVELDQGNRHSQNS